MNELIARTITAVISGIVFLGLYLFSSVGFSIFLGLLLIYILIFEWPKLIYDKRLYFLTPFYPVFPIFCLIYLNYFYRSTSLLIPIYPFIVAWCCDTFSYIFGKIFGRHKICPSISPGKSWEGLLGGLFGVVLLNTFFYTFNSRWLLCGVLLTISAFLGDIFISYLKRKSKLKDVSLLLPGHGGILDRFDSVFFVVVVFCVLLYL